MITAVTVESIRSEENVVNVAAFEKEMPVGVEDPAVSLEVPVAKEPKVDPGPTTAPDPPAARDNSANPTDGGEDRKTVYTFFRNVSPMIQVGTSAGTALLVPRLRSKIAPRHNGLRPLLICPALKSTGLIGHDFPPKDIDTVTSTLQGNAKNPGSLTPKSTDPGIELYKATTSS